MHANAVAGAAAIINERSPRQGHLRAVSVHRLEETTVHALRDF